MPGVEIGGVGPVRMLEGEKERIGPNGNDDRMDVVGHEAIVGQRETMDSVAPAEKVELDEAVGIGLENDPASIASLGDVVRTVESDGASETGHDNRRCEKCANHLKKTSVPGFPGVVQHAVGSPRRRWDGGPYWRSAGR